MNPGPVRIDPIAELPFPLPDPLICTDGTPVVDAEAWRNRRCPELLAEFSSQVYGRTPLGRPDDMRFEVTSADPSALGGLATRKEITVRFAAAASGPSMRLLVYLPNRAPRPCPAFLGLNFYGNHTVHADPGITFAGTWMSAEAPGTVNHRATETARGSQASEWQVESVVARGYATATVYCGDLCPDRPDGLREGVNGWFEKSGTEDRAPDAWGAIGVWAWGLCRALDYLETDPDIDAPHVAVHGHSRLGKTALWAGAQDTRFAAVISNDSGCGGAKLSRHIHGETVARINAVFPHWFCRNFRRYCDNEAALPVDQHELLALVAPRPLYVASAQEDDWADPRGEFLSAREAGKVYRFLGLEGLGVDEMPKVNHPVGDRLRYHIRSGHHDITAYDWSRYLDFADRWLRVH
jgi:hypothetical protein